MNRPRIMLYGHCPHVRLVMCWLLLAASVGGCSHRTLVDMPNPVEIDRVEYTRMYNAAVQVLRDYGFKVDRNSHRFGTITTKYLASPSVFEPWTSTNSTVDLALESTFNQQQRRVIITLEPSEANSGSKFRRSTPNSLPEQYSLRVEVFVERRAHPNRYLTGATASHGLYGTLTAGPGELTHRGVNGSYWRPMGRDPLLEQRLLADIIRSSFYVETLQ